MYRIMIGEEKGVERTGDTTKWVSKGHRIVAAKVKDGKGSFAELEVKLNRDTLLFGGQEWQFNDSLKEYEAIGERGI